MARQSFYSTITAAVRDIEENGYDSITRIQDWVRKIRKAAESSLVSESVLDGVLRSTLGRIYERIVLKGGYAEVNPGVGRFDVKKLEPTLRHELDKRRAVSRQLIKLNREEMIGKTERRFAGWATSVPAGGSRAVDKKDTKDNIAKALKSLPFEERRVMIDQGHKFAADLNEVIAEGNNALAGVWDSRWREADYDYREDHKERDGNFFAVRDNWAIKAGLMKPGPEGYTDDHTKPGQEPFCRCKYKFVFNLRDLPDYMLTEKGRKALEAVRTK